MLIGFFEKPRECECYVIKYVDRIWLSEIGDADVLRTFIVKVNENSPKPLKEIRMLLPFKDIENLESVNETCFLPSSEYYFNSLEVYSTRQYKVVQEITHPTRFDAFGIINDDAIENIKVFPKIDCSFYQVGGCSVIRLELPHELEKGQSTEIRLKFQITSLFSKVTTGLFPNYFVEFPYFSSQYTNEINELDTELEIKVKPILGLAKSLFKGGFDIFLYLPPGFEKVSGFDPFNQKPDFYDIEGKETSQKREKLLWRLRELLKQKELAEDNLTSSGRNILISGILTKTYNIKEAIEAMSKGVPQGFRSINRKICTTTWLSYIAIVLSAITIFITFFLKK